MGIVKEEEEEEEKKKNEEEVQAKTDEEEIQPTIDIQNETIQERDDEKKKSTMKTRFISEPKVLSMRWREERERRFSEE